MRTPACPHPDAAGAESRGLRGRRRWRVPCITTLKQQGVSRMRLLLALAAFTLVAGSAGAEPRSGMSAGGVDWSLERSGDDGRIHLEISRRTGNSHWSI